MTKKVKYPVRFVPKLFEVNAVYDFLVCPYLSVWYCQSTYHSGTVGILGELFLFALPQGIYEVLLERKTKTLKFKGNWDWYHSIFLVFMVKLLSRGALTIFKTFQKPSEMAERIPDEK